MTAPSTRGFRVQAGATSPVTNDHGFDIRGIAPGQLLYFSFYYLATRVSGTDTVTLTSKVRWWDKNDAELTPTTAALTYNASTANFTFYEGSHTAPANAVRGRVNFTLSSSAGTFGLTTIITAIRVARTQFGSTYGARAGTNLFNPDGSPISSADNKLVGLGQNICINSDFSRVGNNLFGWVPSWGGNVANGTVSWGVNFGGYSGQLNVAYTTHTYDGTAGQGGVFDSHYHLPNSNDPQALADLQRWALPVQDGDRVFASALLGVHRCTAQLYLQFFDGTGNASNGTFDHDSVSGNQGRALGGANGDPANFDRAIWFADVPVGARFAALRIRATTINGQANPYIFYTQMMLCKVAAGQTAAPAYVPGPSSDPGAEVNRWIVGPAQNTVFQYDYTGAAQSGEFPRDLTFTLMNSAGAITSTDIVWSQRIVNGTYNGVTGTWPMSNTAGVGTLTPSSLQSSVCTIEVSASYSGQVYTKLFTITQNIAAPPSGSGGTTTLASRSSGYSSTGTTTFGDVTGTSTPLVGTIPSGKTSATVNVQLHAMPASGTSGSWTVECKVMRDVSGTPTQIGTTQSGSSDWVSSDFSGDAANFNFGISDTGLTAGTSYNWRVYMRLTSGTRTHNITGTVSVTS